MPARSPFYEVKMEGEDITAWVTSVTLVEDDRQADNVSLTINDPRMIYSDGLFEGSSAEIDLGYAEANQHALGVGQVTNDLAQRRWQPPNQCRNGQDLIAFGQLRLLEQIDDLDSIATRKVLFAQAFQVLESRQ